MAKTSRSVMVAKGLQRVLNVGLLLLAAILILGTSYASVQQAFIYFQF